MNENLEIIRTLNTIAEDLKAIRIAIETSSNKQNQPLRKMPHDEEFQEMALHLKILLLRYQDETPAGPMGTNLKSWHISVGELTERTNYALRTNFSPNVIGRFMRLIFPGLQVYRHKDGYFYHWNKGDLDNGR